MDTAWKVSAEIIQLAAVHPVGFEPQIVDILFLNCFSYQPDSFIIKFHRRARVYDIKHSVFSADLLKDTAVDFKRITGQIKMIVTESAFSPSASPALKKNELTSESFVY